MKGLERNKVFFLATAIALTAAAAVTWLESCGKSSSSSGADADVDTDTDVDADSDTDTGNPLDSKAVVTLGPYLFNPGPESVEIRWETDLEASSRVVYGKAGSELGFHATGDVVKEDYEGAYTVTPPPGYRHRVTISGLEPGVTYEYRIVSAKDPPEKARFTAAPSSDETVTVVVFGDNRSNHDDHAKVVQAIEDVEPALLVNTGDMVASGRSDGDWHKFFEIEAELLHSRPIYPVMGNHEFALEGSFKFGSYFGGLSRGKEGYFYSFDFGPVHGIVLDTNVNLDQGSRQLEWLKQDLEQVSKRKKQPAVLVFFHHPLYTFSNHDPETGLRSILVPVFENYGVDAVFWGHNHCYERFSVNGIAYITTGGGGAPLYGVDEPSGADAAYFVTGDRVLHYVVLYVSASSLEAKAVSALDGAVIDSFRIDGFD